MDLKNELEFKMKIISIIILFTLTLYGNIFDDLNIKDAQKAYEEKNYVQALNLLNKVRNQNSKIHYNIGNILYKMQKYEEAIIEYKKVIDSDLLHSVIHNIANSYLMLENLDGAIEFYNKALKIQENVLGYEHVSTATSYNNIGSVYKSLGDYKKALELNPNYPEALNNLGNLLTENNNYQEALKCYKGAIHYDGNYGDAFYNIGRYGVQA